MASITITIPDNVLARVLDAFAGAYRWSANGGETKAQFTQKTIRQYVKQVVVSHEAQTAGESARLTAFNDATNSIVLN